MKQVREYVLTGIVTLIIAFQAGPSMAEEPDVIELGPVTVTATKTEVDAEMTPFASHTADREELDAQPAFYMNNIGELVRDKPGVHVGQYYPWGPP